MLVILLYDFFTNIFVKYNNSMVDRMNHVITPHMLLSFILVVLFRYFTSEIIVVAGVAFEGWTETTALYCSVAKTFYLSRNATQFPLPIFIGETEIVRPTATYSNPYYPFYPFVFLLQALLFSLPNWIWQIAAFESGLNPHSFARFLMLKSEFANEESEKKSDMEILAEKTIKVLKFNSRKKLKVWGFVNPKYFLTYAYYFYKASNIFNVILQLFLLKYILRTDYLFFGAELLFDILKGYKWQQSALFPVEVFCDFPRRDPVTGKQSSSTAQVLLPYNAMYQYFFIIIWSWLMILLLLNIIEFLKFSLFMNSRKRRILFLEDILEFFGIDREADGFYYFVDKIMHKDGFTFLYILNFNCIEHGLTCFVFALYKALEKFKT